MSNLGTALPPVAPRGMDKKRVLVAGVSGAAMLAGLYAGWTYLNSPSVVDPAAASQHEREVSAFGGTQLPDIEYHEPTPITPEPIRHQEAPRFERETLPQKSERAGMRIAERDDRALEQASAGAVGGGVSAPIEQARLDPQSAFIANARSRNHPTVYTPPDGRLMLKRSTIVQASMLNAVNTDLPGDAAAMVNHDVLDSTTLRYVLIPAGSILYGKLNPQLVYGQTRNQIAWTSVEFPTGGTLDLGGMAATDASGAAGVRGYVDRHHLSMAGAIAGSAFFSIIGQAGTLLRGDGGETNIGVIGADAAGGEMQSVGGELVRRELNRKNTLGLNGGDPVAVMLSDNVYLPPYEAAR